MKVGFCVAESEQRYQKLERKYQDLAGRVTSPAD
jgi:hypothetical protein